jgi:BlaI family transcriptional regulator, penicillinase repressor
MAKVPEAGLTPVQFEILEVAWSAVDKGAAEGASVAEIWEAVATSRDVGRTTILNLVDRLEKRGWLARKKVDGVFRYRPTVSRDEAAGNEAVEFVDAFFSGSASELVMSLLGSKKISAAEVAELRAVLDARSRDKKGKETR